MLYIVATPIGNLDDLSERARKVLREADVIACEDTRRTRALLSRFDIPRPAVMLSYRQQTERKAGDRLFSLLEKGRTVVLCSDGGYPGISDPGYRLVSEAAARGLEFHVVPGACAVTVALVASALPSSSYTFKGFPPRKAGALRRFFDKERGLPHTLVLYESPFRVGKTLGAALEVLGDRRAAVCIELTKKYERVLRGYLSELLTEAGSHPIKGEVAIVIAGNHPKFVNPQGP